MKKFKVLLLACSLVMAFVLPAKSVTPKETKHPVGLVFSVKAEKIVVQDAAPVISVTATAAVPVDFASAFTNVYAG
jgi:hypothetical protein